MHRMHSITDQAPGRDLGTDTTTSRIDRKNMRKAPRMTATYPTCDHPRLLVKDEVCFLCDQIDGQTDALNEVCR